MKLPEKPLYWQNICPYPIALCPCMFLQLWTRVCEVESHGSIGQTQFMQICPSLYSSLLFNTKAATIATSGSQNAYGTSEGHIIVLQRYLKCMNLPQPHTSSLPCAN